MKLPDPFVLLGRLSFGTAYSEAAKGLLVGWLDCNWEIMSAGYSGFVCSPTSLLPAFTTFTGVHVILVQLAQEGSSSDSVLFVLEGKGLANQGHGPALPVHLA